MNLSIAFHSSSFVSRKHTSLRGGLTDSLPWHNTLTDEDVYQPLQRLHILPRQEIIVHRHRDKVHEATVQLQMAVDVPKWIVPVIVVQVCVAAEHLLYDRFDVCVIIWWEARGLTDPVVWVES